MLWWLRLAERGFVLHRNEKEENSDSLGYNTAAGQSHYKSCIKDLKERKKKRKRESAFAL
jgi:hypothetical protein